MSGTAGNILTGPVTLFRGAAGAAASAITTEIGYTEDGLQLSYGDTQADLEVDEALMPLKAVRTGAEITLSFQMAEATLKNLLYAYGLPAAAYDEGDGTLTIDPAFKVEYSSLKAVGTAPGSKTRTYVFPQVAVRGQRQTAIRKGQKVLIPVELAVYKGAGAVATITDAS